MEYTYDEIQSGIKRVLEIEKEGIARLINSVGNNAVELVQICKKCCGKVVFTGIGKSGHVAKKISTTMASLGTPSFFLHPAEAAHGDLGMLQSKDIVVMISNSGETDELIQLIPNIKILGCKLVGVFCKEESTLSKYCDLTVVLPIEKEACINNLAPTTSTTVTLAFGDAIAVTLSEMNHFSEKDFALFHPKGTLGKKLLVTVENLCSMHMSDVSVLESQNVEEILFTITKNRLGAVAVVGKDNRLQGLISDGDVRRLIEKKGDFFSLKACEVMTKNVITVKTDALAIDTFYLMQEKKISVIPIVSKENLLIGMLSLHDIISAGIA